MNVQDHAGMTPLDLSGQGNWTHSMDTDMVNLLTQNAAKKGKDLPGIFATAPIRRGILGTCNKKEIPFKRP